MREPTHPTESWNFESHWWNSFSQWYDGLIVVSDPEMHLKKFPDSMKFRSWKVNFKAEVCSKTADLQLTVQWIEEIVIAKSIDELMTSRSIVERTDFTDYDMLDAMIASALKKLLDKNVHFR